MLFNSRLTSSIVFDTSFVALEISSVDFASFSALSLTFSITVRRLSEASAISPIAVSIFLLALSEFRAVSLELAARLLISVATTANPRPASPALAASIEAFKASRFVCPELLV